MSPQATDAPRKLLVLRHAHAQDTALLSDHGRGLTDKGQWQAADIAQAIASYAPDAVRLSDAVRTTETVVCVEHALQRELPDKASLRSLYLPAVTDLLTAASTLPTTARVGLLVSHNPGCGQLIRALTGHDVSVSTAQLTVIDVYGSWSQLTPTHVLGLDWTPGTLTQFLKVHRPSAYVPRR